MWGLDLFSGIGGITKALEGYITPVAYCENDRYCQAVLLSRMAKGELPIAPIWDDVRTLCRAILPNHIDIIYGGFPCQDISIAGLGAGLGGERSGLFFEIIRLVSEIRPRFVFLENVSAITVRGAERVVGEFCRLRYDTRWGILSAADVGANHRRERWWMLAHANGQYGERRSERSEPDGQSGPAWNQSERGGDELANAHGDGTKRDEPAHGEGRRTVEAGQDVADPAGERCGEAGEVRPDESTQRIARSGDEVSDTDGSGCQERRRAESVRQEQSAIECDGEKVPYAKGDEWARGRPVWTGWAGSTDSSWWKVEPPLGRLVDGLSFRVDMLRALGNSVVPFQAREAFERLMGLKTLTCTKSK